MKPATRRRAYLIEAGAVLVLARLAIRFVPAARLFAWADRAPRRMRRFAADEAGWVVWAVAEVGARPLIKAQCLPRALAAHAMLRRRGIASRLCLGVARSGGAVAAHAWVEFGGDKLVGGREAAGFTRLAGFGGARG